MNSITETEHRDWDWDTDGALDGMYVETRQVSIRSGPSAGMSKLVFDFHCGPDDELVSAWETTVLRSKLREELSRRRRPDFESGERIRIQPIGKKASANGTYRDFDVTFEFAAPKPTAAQLLAESDETGDSTGGQESPDDDIPFGRTSEGGF